MWICKQCGEQVEDQFVSCWRCSSPKIAKQDIILPEVDAGTPNSPQKKIEYRIFRGTFSSWQDLFDQAAAFATEIGPRQLVGISHSEDHSEGVVAVWYWTHLA